MELTPEEIAELKDALWTVSEILDCSMSEIVNAFEGDLIDEETAGELKYGG